MVPHEPEKAGGMREEVGWQSRTRPAGGGCGGLSLISVDIFATCPVWPEWQLLCIAAVVGAVILPVTDADVYSSSLNCSAASE